MGGLQGLSKFIVNILVTDLVENSIKNIKSLCKKYDINNNSDFNEKKHSILIEDYSNSICFSTQMAEEEKRFHTFLKDKVLNSHIVQVMDGKASFIIRQLFKAYVTNPQQLPDHVILQFYQDFKPNLSKNMKLEDIGISRLRQNLDYNFRQNNRKNYRQHLTRSICDYIALMTDNMAYKQFEILYGTTKVLL